LLRRLNHVKCFHSNQVESVIQSYMGGSGDWHNRYVCEWVSLQYSKFHKQHLLPISNFSGFVDNPTLYAEQYLIGRKFEVRECTSSYQLGLSKNLIGQTAARVNSKLLTFAASSLQRSNGETLGLHFASASVHGMSICDSLWQ